MQQIKLRELITGLGELTPDIANETVSVISSDSREIIGGEVFVAVKGENDDGHDYVANALSQGAVLAVVENAVENAPQERVLVVENTLDAMISMGANYRNLYNTEIIAVTGSVGKTTTKEFLHAVLSAFDKTLKNEGNQNNELGLPRTIFNLDDSYRYAVLEMGMDALGDISKLSLAAKPKVAVITNVGVAHIENLGSRENILAAKLEVCDGLAEGGTLIINADNDLLSKVEGIKGRQDIKIITFGIDNENAMIKAKKAGGVDLDTEFIIENSITGVEYSAQIPALGKHNIYNALAAYTVAFALGLKDETAVSALKNYESCGMRQRIISQEDFVVIEDCYNANPDSVKAAISTLAELPNAGYCIAVLGDMLELGEHSESAHREIGDELIKHRIDAVVCYGEQAKYIAENAKKSIENVAYTDDMLTAMDHLNEFFQDGAAVLFKASRGMKLEEMMELFYRQKGV